MKRVKQPNGKWEFYLGGRRISRSLYGLLTGVYPEDDPFEQRITYITPCTRWEWTWPRHPEHGRLATSVTVQDGGYGTIRWDYPL